MTFPNPIGGPGKLASWLNKLLVAGQACRIKSVIGGRLVPSSDGVSIVIDPAPAAPAAVVPAAYGPLTSAVWDATRSKIFGVRAGYIFQFDAGGLMEDSRQFATIPLGDSHVVHDTGRDILVCTHWWDQGNRGEPPIRTRKGLYVLDPDNLSLIEFIPWSVPSGESVLQAITPDPAPNNQGLTSTHVGLEMRLAWTTIPNTYFPAGSPGLYSTFNSTDPLEFGPFDQDVYVSGSVDYAPEPTAAESRLHPLPIPVATSSGGEIYYSLSSIALPAGETLSVDFYHDGGDAFLWVAGLTDNFHFLSWDSPILNAWPQSYAAGPRRLYVMPDGDWLVLDRISGYHFGDNDCGVRRYDYDLHEVTTIHDYFSWDSGDASGTNAGWYELDFDASNLENSDPEADPPYESEGVIWVSNDMHLSRLDISGSGQNNTEVYPLSGGVPTGMLFGFDYCASNGKFYAATKSGEIATVLRASPYTVATFSPAALIGQEPVRLRYAPFKSRIYVPCLAGNIVVEINPATNTVTHTYAGFDAPYDILVASSDAWDFATEYQIAESVEFGGMLYSSLTININSQPDENPTDWTAGGTPAVYAVQLGKIGLRLVV